MNTQKPTPRAQAAQAYCAAKITNKNAEPYLAWYGYMSEHSVMLELELAEKDAQIAALREALGGIKVYMQSDWRKRPCDGEAQVINRIDKALSTPPPPVVSLEDVRPLVEALNRYTESERWILEDAEWRFVDDPKNNWFSPQELAEKATSSFTFKYHD